MTAKEYHNDKVRDLAEQYRQKGYDVTIEPSPAAIPGFEPNLQPDLLARKDRDQVVIEVKSRSGLRNSDAVRRMADALAHKPDWRFELVVLEDAGSEPTPAVSTNTIRSQLASGELLLKQGQSSSAFMLMWIAVEAALRKLASTHHLQFDDASPTHLMRELSFNGVIGRDDFELLNQKLQFRNQVVHGFEAPGLTPQDVNILRDLATRLIAEGEKQSAAAA